VETNVEERTREIPYTVMVPETRTQVVRVMETRTEERTREVPYTVMVPKTVEREVTEIVYKPVTEEKLITYTEMVPETIERTARVPETRMVAREINYTIPGQEPLRR
jgi:hypothetical protein